ncbi:MAG: peroxiredoxin [Mariprofundaceae bacterium]
MSDYKLNIGDEAASDIELASWPEGSMKLASLREQWVILYFYPKDSTPGCTTESCEFRDALPDFSAANAVIVGVSRDSVKSHANFAEKQSLPFTLLADTDEALCTAFDVMQMKNMYGKQLRGVERSTFVINPDGKVVELWRKVKVKGHVDIVLNRLRDLQG